MTCALRITLGLLVLGAVQSVRGEGEPNPATAKGSSRPVNFARDIRPILSENCFACHGPDDKSRKASLRLDTKEGAFAKLKEGGLAIASGKPEASELIDRVESDDPNLKMPPPKSGKALTPDQIATLRAGPVGARSPVDQLFDLSGHCRVELGGRDQNRVRSIPAAAP